MKKLYLLLLIMPALFLFGCAHAEKKNEMDVSTLPMPEPVVETRTAGSLWPGVSARNRYFSDFRARDIGDIITVLITESTSAKGEAKTDTGSSSENDLKIEDLFGAPLNFGMEHFLDWKNPFSPTVKGGRSTAFSGNGSTERTANITAKIAVRVTQVLSNGNLYVQGRKETSVNRERQYVILSGIIRPEDVSSLNTVSSDSISDLRVELSGYGVVSNKQKPGWFTGVLDATWPF